MTDLLTLDAVAARLSVSVDSVRRHVLPHVRAVRIGALIRIPAAEVEAWLERQQGGDSIEIDAPVRGRGASGSPTRASVTTTRPESETARRLAARRAEASRGSVVVRPLEWFPSLARMVP